MRPRSIMMLLGALGTLWLVQVPRAQAPTEEELKEFERQAEQLEKKQAAAKAEAKRRAEAAKKAPATAEAKRKAARKRAEEERRPAEEARSAGPESDGRERATQAASTLAGEFVDVPGGSFQMVCLPGYIECDDDERPEHTVSIKPFRMSKYEVTVSQFRRFVEAVGYRTDAERARNCLGVPGAEPAGRDWRNPGFPQTERHPVVCVSWNDAEAYAQWLSRQGVGRYRLPSVSEWEYAARAASRAQHSFADSKRMLCQYGNVADRAARQRFLKNNWKGIASCDDGAVYTAPVGGYRPNGFGLHDMQGNVWEWTGDCYHDRDASAPPDGVALTAGDCARRVLLGGSWYGPPWIVGTTLRFGYVTDTRAGALGFRLLQDR